MLKLLQKFPLRHSRFEVPNLRHYKRWVFVATISPYQRLLRSYLSSGKFIDSLPGKVDALTGSLSISQDGKWLATAGGKLWDLTTKTKHKSLGNIPAQIESIAFLPDGRHVIGIQNLSSKSPRLGRFLNIWNLQTGKLEISKSTDGSRLFVSPDGKNIVSTSPIEIWKYE